ncbi:monoglyceride lipase isoform X1 [Rhincodon typus]|uniref:monoglyceride lipase isoform X1 n=2 Tax=Rhincodon typus TaxID=259920 RepID=UPI00202F1025|nr:monoglyceride lipase isoform X1 [Rhincodon typus]
MLDGSGNRVTPQGLLYKDLSHFVNADGNYIFCRYWEPPEPPRALVMIIHGAGEHSGRYAEVVSMLTKQSLFVFSHDHIGHGQSEGKRMVASDFRIYVRDCLQHLDLMKDRHPGMQIFLFAHSMGGLMAIYIVHERPEDIAGVIFVAPLVILNPEAATPLKVFCARILDYFLPNVALGYMDPHSLSRDEKEVKDYIDDPLNYHGPVRVRFATMLLNAVSGVEKILPTITTQILLLHGNADKLCDISGSYLFYEIAASSDKTLKVFEGSFHQLHKELTEVTEEMFELIEKWLSERLSPVKT